MTRQDSGTTPAPLNIGGPAYPLGPPHGHHVLCMYYAEKSGHEPDDITGFAGDRCHPFGGNFAVEFLTALNVVTQRRKTARYHGSGNTPAPDQHLVGQPMGWASFLIMHRHPFLYYC